MTVNFTGAGLIKADYVKSLIQPFRVTLTFKYETRIDAGWTAHTWRCTDAKVIGWKVLKPAPDGSLRVVDYKTGRFPRDPEGEIAKDLAAAVYAAGASRDFVGAPVGAIEYLYLGEMRVLAFPVDPGWRAARERTVETLAHEARAAEAADAFPAKPTRLCAWCDFVRLCPEGQAFLDAREDG